MGQMEVPDFCLYLSCGNAVSHCMVLSWRPISHQRPYLLLLIVGVMVGVGVLVGVTTVLVLKGYGQRPFDVPQTYLCA